MNEAIASRSAGAKLLAILIILVIPMLVLSYLMVDATRKDITFTSNELKGALLLEATVPFMLDATANKTDPAKHLKLETLTAALVEELGTSTRAKELSVLVKTATTSSIGNNVNYVKVLSQSNEFLHETGTQSGLLLDPFEETYFLAHTSVVTMPSVISVYHSTRSALKKITADNSLTTEEYLHIAKKLGELNQALSVAEDSISHAKKGMTSTITLDNVKDFINAIKFESTSLATSLAQERVFAGEETLKPLLGFASEKSEITKLERAALFNVTAQLKTILIKRINGLSQKLYLLLSIAGFCLLAAVGSALSMFKSTLKKLDHVETARGEAENMATQLSAMNNEMVTLNQDLSANMKKLKDAQDDLVKKGRMEQLGQLTATIAHELRNPLGAVRTSTFLLERKIKGKGLEVEKQFERINNGIVRCDNIITQLLDYSRTKQLTKKDADLDQWLVGIIEETAKELPPAVQIECSLGLDGKHIAFDASRMERAIINLVNNASEAMVGNGSDAARLQNAAPTVSVSTSIHRGNVHIVVSDNGPGVSPENLQRIREPLFTTKSFGTGLGIPAIEQIANQHGGELRIESILGQGASFTFVLPLDVEISEEKEVA